MSFNAAPYREARTLSFVLTAKLVDQPSLKRSITTPNPSLRQLLVNELGW
jgi:hypothetical protein